MKHLLEFIKKEYISLGALFVILIINLKETAIIIAVIIAFTSLIVYYNVYNKYKIVKSNKLYKYSKVCYWINLATLIALLIVLLTTH